MVRGDGGGLTFSCFSASSARNCRLAAASSAMCLTRSSTLNEAPPPGPAPVLLPPAAATLAAAEPPLPVAPADDPLDDLRRSRRTDRW